MANTITFRGFFIRSIHITVPAKGDKYVVANCTADLTDTVMDKMDWGTVVPALDGDLQPSDKTIRVIDEGLTGGDLKGILLATNMVITPSSREMKKHELDLDIRKVGSFQIVTVNEKGEGVRRELRFQIESAAKLAGARLEGYTNAMGRERGLLKVQYEKQEDLPLEPGQPVGQEELMPTEDEPQELRGEALASWREVEGRKKRVPERTQ